ncbi:MAG: hypothetical protein IPK35_18630 [Saprospiraceae bacterium]|nr:hypothetical protein [Saprospiraceae bacterium]
MKFHYLIVISVISSFCTHAQSPYILRGDQAYHTYDRAEILRLSDTTLINGINNYDRNLTVDFFKNIWQNDELTKKDRYDLLHIFSDNFEFLVTQDSILMPDSQNEVIFREGTNESLSSHQQINKSVFEQKPILKYFYKTPANLLQLHTPSFELILNPVMQLSYHHQVNNENIVFQNIRGLEARAYIDKKVYFYTQLLETQRSFLDYTESWIKKYGTIPGQGFWKNYNSGVISNLKGYDYFNARAYVGFNPVKSINIEFGHGNHFIGNGYRSLLLSDFSHNYFYLKFNTRIWKFHYQNIFAEMAPTSTLLNPGDNLLPKKYTATHYLAFKPNNRFEVGIFETVVFARENHFEFQYLNPVILYRAVEHYLDSPDNVILGLNAKWNPLKGISIYGQFVMDEFKLSEVKKQSGWWANKFGAQIGLKYVNALGIDHLDLQVEYNAVRPYTYAHRDTLMSLSDYSVANYSHSNQPLAHPLGANFRELLCIARYKPFNRMYIQAKALLTTYGADRSGENWGGNILAPLQTIEQEYGNVIGQGLKTKVAALNVDVSYELFHNYYIDLQGMWRKTKSDITTDQHYIGGGFRVNIANIHYDY